jgi:hypothetical protein
VRGPGSSAGPACSGTTHPAFRASALPSCRAFAVKVLPRLLLQIKKNNKKNHLKSKLIIIDHQIDINDFTLHCSSYGFRSPLQRPCANTACAATTLSLHHTSTP